MPPDLVVPSVSVSDTNPAPGATVEISVTVENRGEGPSSPTTLRYHRSGNSIIGSADDPELDSHAVAAIAASATESGKVELEVSTEPGAWFYLGACIDSVPGESDTSNNCSDGVRVDVKRN